MTMSSSCSRVFLSCDPLLDILAEVKSPMVKHQSDPSHYHQQHSDSSLSSSFGSSSLSPSTVATTTTMTLTAAAAPRTTSTTALGDIDPELAQHIEYELGLIKRNNAVGSGTRKNAWGNLSYAELISKAITTSAEQRLTLSEVYDWMIKYVPFFRNKVDRASSAGWKNSIRHNLSLHNRFKRVQSEGTGKSSWWMINPDEKNIPSSVIGSNTSLSKNGTKQGRRRLGQNSKSISSSNTTKRLRNSRSIKSSRTSIANQRQQPETSVSQQISPLDISSIPIYDTQWTNQLESDNSVNHLYEQDFYSTSINTPLTNSNGNSTGGIPSAYPFDDGTSANSSSNNHNSSDYSYHQFSHHHHHHHHQHHSHPHSHSLYHHHNSNYALAPNNTTYYQQQSMLNDHSTNECHPPMDTYSTNNLLTYSLQAQQHQQQQQQQLLIDPNDDQQLYLRAHSRSSQSSSASLSPPIVTTNNTLGSSSSSTSSYSYSQKGSSLSGGYYHPNSNGTLTLYGHHHSTVETLLRLTGDDEENDGDDDDDDDLSTLVHHHPGLTDDYQLLSHQEPSTSILRTVLKRSTIDMHNQQV